MYQEHSLARIFPGLSTIFDHFDRPLFVHAGRDLGLYYVQQEVAVFGDETGFLVEALGEALQFVVIGEIALVGSGDEVGVYFGFRDAGFAVFLDPFRLFRGVCLQKLCN